MLMILFKIINLKKQKQNKKEMNNKEVKVLIDKLDLKELKYLEDKNREQLQLELY